MSRPRSAVDLARGRARPVRWRWCRRASRRRSRPPARSRGAPSCAISTIAGSGSGPSVTCATSSGRRAGRRARDHHAPQLGGARARSPSPPPRRAGFASTSAPAGSCACAAAQRGIELREREAVGCAALGIGLDAHQARARRRGRAPAPCSGTSESSRATSSAILRSSPAGRSPPWSVSVRKGTSSMVRRRTSGFSAPAGSSSGWPPSSWCTFDQARLERLVDLEPHGERAPRRPARAVKVLDARDAPEAALERRRELGLDLARAAPGRATMTSTIGTTICGSSSRGVSSTATTPRRSEADDDERRQLAARGRSAPAGRPGRARRTVSTSTGHLDRLAVGGPGASITTSPACRPARTATRSPVGSPIASQRSSARPRARRTRR